MQEMIIVTGKKYDYTDGTEKKAITKKQAEKLFTEWKKQGKTINRKFGMNGRVCWVWVEA